MASQVEYLSANNLTLSKSDLHALADSAQKLNTKKSRICTHVNEKDNLHEMFIYHAQDAYVRPHKHLKKGESFFLIEGEIDAVFFHDKGDIKNVIPMGRGEESVMYYRINDPVYHCMLIRSPYVLFYEATLGPFIKEDTDFATWSPEENSPNVDLFQQELSRKVDEFCARALLK